MTMTSRHQGEEREGDPYHLRQASTTNLMTLARAWAACPSPPRGPLPWLPPALETNCTIT